MLKNYQCHQTRRLAKPKPRWNEDGSIIKIEKTHSFLRQSSQNSLHSGTRSRTHLHKSPSMNRFDRDLNERGPVFDT